MRVDYTKRRRPQPLEGIKLTREERKQVAELVKVLTVLPSHTCRVIRDACARQADYLEEVGQWTSPEDERERLEQWGRALVLYTAAYEASFAALKADT